MKEFADYTSGVRVLVRESLRSLNRIDLKVNPEILSLLDGGPARQVRRLLPIKKTRRDGAFFTGQRLADELLGLVSVKQLRKGGICDPTCGSGDLLLAAARRLGGSSTPNKTLSAWSRLLFGWDKEPQFVSLARARLSLAGALASKQRGGGQPIENRSGFFSGVVTRDLLEHSEKLREFNTILFNPPYTLAVSKAPIDWGSGIVNHAAVFLDQVLQAAKPGAVILGILPEVLRSGPRYAAWRAHVAARAESEEVVVSGQFDEWTDVHVYLTKLRVRKLRSPSAQVAKQGSSRKTIGDCFYVNVGAVVPHRDEEEGPNRAYLHSRNSPSWAVVRRINESRQFDRKVFEPPFVVIRRTSRPGDKHRAVATLIVGTRKVAVENHLIVLKPRRGGIPICMRLMGSLRTTKTTEWLDMAIRCRHLTVEAVRSIPFEGSAK